MYIAFPIQMRYNVISQGVGARHAHECKLNVKTSPDKAFRDCLVPSRRLGMYSERLRLKTCGRAAMSSISSLWLETRF